MSRAGPEVALAVTLGTAVSALPGEVHALVTDVGSDMPVLGIETAETELGLDADVSPLLH